MDQVTLHPLSHLINPSNSTNTEEKIMTQIKPSAVTELISGRPGTFAYICLKSLLCYLMRSYSVQVTILNTMQLYAQNP